MWEETEGGQCEQRLFYWVDVFSEAVPGKQRTVEEVNESLYVMTMMLMMVVLVIMAISTRCLWSSCCRSRHCNPAFLYCRSRQG